MSHFGTSRYVTGILAGLDLADGRLVWINRGHHPPLLIRGNRRVIELGCPPADPMGTDLNLPITECHQAGRLADDATVLPAEWRGGHQHGLTP